MNTPFTRRLFVALYNRAVKTPFLSLLLVLFLMLAVPWARADHESVRREVQSGKLKPLTEILQTVQKRHAGRVLDVELERSMDGRRWYEIKMMLNGQRTEIHVDAVTGEEIPKPDTLAAPAMSMAEVLRAVARSHPGAVLKVELETAPGSPPYYEFQMLARDGKESILRVDAQTAKPLAVPPVDHELAAGLMPLPGILEALEKRFNARATEVELKLSRKRKAYYEIDLRISSGRSIELHVDAASGQILGEDE